MTPPNTPPDNRDLAWLDGCGEAGALIRAFDWTATGLGPIERWPQSLRTVTALLLLSPVPLVLLFLAGAMGCLHGVLLDETIASPTDMLAQLARKLGEALMGGADRWGWVPECAFWLSFLAGAVIGAAGLWRWGDTALWLAPMAAVALATAMTRMRTI